MVWIWSYWGKFGVKTELCPSVNIFWPQHAHFAHGRSRITCMYILSVFTRDGMQGEYFTTQVCGPVVLVGAKMCSWSPEKYIQHLF